MPLDALLAASQVGTISLRYGHVYVPVGLADELPTGTYVIRSVEAAPLQGIGRVELLDVQRSVSGR